MVQVLCDNCGLVMDCTDSDSRQEWTEETYNCDSCGKQKIHRTEYNQLGLVTSDEVYAV